MERIYLYENIRQPAKNRAARVFFPTRSSYHMKETGPPRRLTNNERTTHMKTQELHNDTVKTMVRERYGRIAEHEGSCFCSPTCCTPTRADTAKDRDAATVSQGLGYSAEETGAVPEGSNLGLGCGNPQAIAALKPGETVLDLGSVTLVKAKSVYGALEELQTKRHAVPAFTRLWSPGSNRLDWFFNGAFCLVSVLKPDGLASIVVERVGLRM